MGRVANLWRHPIKSHGREALERVALTAGETFPWDRHWAVTHEQTKFSAADPQWVGCRNFMIGTLVPALAGIWARFDEASGEMTLRHIARGEITFRPDDPADVTRFLDWVAPLSADSALTPTALVSAGPRGMTDTDYPSITVMTHASHAAVSARLGGALEVERWRGNIWLDGVAPWEEMEWTGRHLRIGSAILAVREPAQRCKHTMANPRTGQRDAETLAALSDRFGHQDFGIYCEVVESGDIALGDTAEVI